MNSLSRSSLDSLIFRVVHSRGVPVSFSVPQAEALCSQAESIFLDEPTLLELSGPIHVCGDIHGQLTDLVRCFQFSGLPPTSRWLFLGDYVDRGPQSVEVLCCLFALKIRYPSDIFLIRGNHETRDMAMDGGFFAECLKKLNDAMWESFCNVFDALPLAAVVNHMYFCVHGGISPKLKTLDQIREIMRPLDCPESGLMMDLLWSDPSPGVQDFSPSSRGATFLWGIKPADDFLSKTGLKMIVRGHQVAVNGSIILSPHGRA
jgi:serine/threonine-protein phosphatase PP1 catalytic subunit